MADDTDATKQPAKRRLKPTGETVRERTEKFEQQKQTASERKPSVLRAFWRGFTAPLRALGRGIQSLERFRVFRIIGHIIFPHYFRNSWRELRMVTWPDRRTSWKLTYAVIIFSLIFGVIIFIVDFGLDKLFKEIILK